MNKNMQVQIKDYQIIKKMSLEFVPGLNVIIGPSNNGKSSILKAIKAATFTIPGTSPIRFGQSNYTVGIQYNGHVVILQKGLKESLYIVDGEKYSKFGQITPEIVANSLNIKELVLNGNKEQLNFWDQMNYPFLLDKTGVEMFRFVIDSGENDKLSDVLKSMVSDRQNLNKNIDILQGSINAVDLEIDNYKKELDDAKPIIEASTNIILLQQQVSKLNLLKDLKNKIDVNKTKLIEIKVKQETQLNYYNTIKEINSNISDLANKQVDLTNYLLKLKDLRNSLLNINDKLKPIIYIDIKEEDINKIINLKSILNKHNEISHDLSAAYNNLNDYSLYLNHNKELKEYFKICPYCGNPIHN